MMAQQTAPPMMNDPVQRAVVDNIMGNLPTKKPQVRCYDCGLDFTSQAVLDAHVHGARHAKQIKSKTILESLEQTNVAFSKDQETNGLRCNVCNVYLNSIQQLQTHLSGNRHKKKIASGDWSGQEIVSKDPALAQSMVQKAKEGAKGLMLTCDVCHKFFNSNSQYGVHIASQKHLDKVNKKENPNKKKRFFPYWKKGKGNEGNSAMTNMITSSVNSISTNIPLSNSFVSGGFQNY